MATLNYRTYGKPLVKAIAANTLSGFYELARWLFIEWKTTTFITCESCEQENIMKARERQANKYLLNMTIFL